MLIINGASVKIGNLDGVAGVGEINHREPALVPSLNEDIPPRNWHYRSIMRNTVFLLDLRRRNFEVAAVLEFAIHNVIDSVSAPI